MNNRNVVVQDNQLINSKYKLNSSELKFILVVIAQLRKEDTEFTEYDINVSQLEHKLQAEQNETRLKNFGKKLLQKPLEIPTEDGWILANWFSDIEYIRGQSTFKVTISNKLRPYLLELKDTFTKYNLKYMIPLTGIYSMRIYQFLKEIEYKKEKKRTFVLDELHELLQVPKSFKGNYGMFKRKVLNFAQKELLEHCDIYFEKIDYKLGTEIKEGKRVNEIVFKIKTNPKFQKQEKAKEPQLFDDTVSADERVKGFKGQKIYLENKLYFFKSLEKNQDTKSDYYNNYIIFLSTPDGGTVKKQLAYQQEIGAISEVVKLINEAKKEVK